MTNPLTAYVGMGRARAPLYFAGEEGGVWEKYDGRPYAECAAIGFEHGGEMIVLDFVLWRKLEAGKPSAHPVTVGSLPLAGLP